VQSDERLINKFLDDKTHITIEDCNRLLISFGYKFRKTGGSHRVYHKKGNIPIIVVIPKNTKYVKPGYVELLIKKIEPGAMK